MEKFEQMAYMKMLRTLGRVEAGKSVDPAFLLPKRRHQKKTGKLVTSANKEGGGSGQKHDIRFL